MKKIFLCAAVALAMIFAMAGCSATYTPSAAWADSETLVYKITDTLGSTLGEMTVTMERNPDDRTLNGKEYSTADSKCTVNIVTETEEINIVSLVYRYSVLASAKTYSDADGNAYVLNSYHSGKNYYYSYDGGEEKKIKTASTGYTDSEFIYQYIRCYSPSSPPSSIKIADPSTGSAVTVSCTAVGTTTLNVPYPSGTKEVGCAKIAVTLSSEPQGKPIYAYYTPDSADYYVAGLSVNLSKKFPVRMEENDVIYTLTSIEVK